MLVNQGVKPEEGDLALSAVPCKEDNPEECALNPWRPLQLSLHVGNHSVPSHCTRRLYLGMAQGGRGEGLPSTQRQCP